MELIERPNMRAVHYLHSISYATHKKEWIEDAVKKGETRPKESDMRKWFSMLQSFCKANIKTKGHTTRIYAHSLITPAGGGGRLFCGNSMQGIWGIYRGLLMRGISTDIDMVNAHPCILEYICKKHDIDCPTLAYYNANREACLSKFANRNIGKKAYLSATNDDKFSRRSNMPVLFRAYDKEMKVIQTRLVSLPDYAEIGDIIPAYKESKNYNGSYINHILCHYENIILNHALHVTNSRGIETAIFMFDGKEVYGDYYGDNVLLAEITDYVESQIPGLNMRWAYKEHDNTLTIPDDFDENKYGQDENRRYVTDDNAAANLIFAEVKDIMMPAARKRMFLKVDNVWVCDSDAINTYLLNLIMESNICKTNDDNKYVPYGQNVKNAKNVREAVIEKIRGQKDLPDIYSKFHTTTRGRLCFRDGVLDMRARRFVRWADVDFEYYSTVMIPYNFGPYFNNPDRDTVDTVQTRIFESMFGDKSKRALHFLARGIAGEIVDKNWGTYLGNRDCGKGVLYDALKSACCDYVQTFELGNLLYERNVKTDEVSRKLYWAMELEFVRLAVSQETPSDEKLKFNGAMMKKLAGGGDEIVARRNFDTHDTHFTLDSTFLIMGNNALRPDKPDCLEHCVEFSSVFQFKSQAEIDRMKAAGEDALVWGSYKIKDDQIKPLCASDAWRMAVVYLLYENYCDEAVTIVRDIEDEAEMSIRRRILLHYEVTRDDADCVLADDLHTNIADCKKKISNEMAGMGLAKRKSARRDETRNKMCYWGLRVREVLNEEDTSNIPV